MKNGSRSREAPLYPKSSGQSATNENQVVTPFNWHFNADKTVVYVTMKSGYVLALETGELTIDEESLIKPSEIAIFHNDKLASETSPCGTGVWCTTPLNEVVYNGIEGCTHDLTVAHTVTVPAGTYYMSFFHEFVETEQSMARIYNVTAGAVVNHEQSLYADSTAGGSSVLAHNFFVAEFSEETTIRLEHYYSNSSSAEIGYGSGTHAGLEIRRLK